MMVRRPGSLPSHARDPSPRVPKPRPLGTVDPATETRADLPTAMGTDDEDVW